MNSVQCTVHSIQCTFNIVWALLGSSVPCNLFISTSSKGSNQKGQFKHKMAKVAVGEGAGEDLPFIFFLIIVLGFCLATKTIKPNVNGKTKKEIKL